MPTRENRPDKPVRLIRGGTVVLPNSVIKADILIAQERIQALLDRASADVNMWVEVDETIDAEGLMVFPGIIDSHVHFATGTPHCDTLIDVTRAAALGGVTTIVGHVWSPQGDILAEIARQRELVGCCPIDIAFHAILTPQEPPEDTVFPLIEQGVRSFKFFMAYQERGLRMDESSLYQAFRQVAKCGGLALIHAEHGDIIAAIEAELAAAERTAITDYPASRPVEAEVEAIRRSLWLAELAGCPLYIVHVSTAAGLNVIVQEKERYKLDPTARPPVYAETCPQYVLLNEESYETLGNKAKVAPPLRSKRDQQTLYRALLSGTVDTLASDHAPYPVELKDKASFLEVQGGAPGVQTLFPLILSRLLEEQRRVDSPFRDDKDASGAALVALQRAMSLRPAEIFGLYPRKGWIGPGADADLVLVDPSRKWQVTKDWLVSNSGFSLYEGQALQGKPIHSLVRGRWVLRNEQLVNESGGQYLGR